jgi:hypothetical protein
MRAYNVTLAGKVVDTVYFPDGTPESEVKHGLINTVSTARSKYLDPGIVSTNTGGVPNIMRAYNVILAGQVIDTVYFVDGTPESEVRHSLINSDGFDPGIIVDAQLSRSEIVSAIDGAIAKSGKNIGKLKAKCPRSDTDAAAAWQALQMEANPYKVSMATCLFFSTRQTKIFNAVIETIREKNIDVRGLDRDRVALESIGVW